MPVGHSSGDAGAYEVAEGYRKSRRHEAHGYVALDEPPLRIQVGG
ncbi:hypothetical protein [Thermanaeromonas toyohensis]|nr:hypothetical protein [Thermanaeromonas toyohensis]